MHLICITIIEHDDPCFCGTISKDEFDFAMFCYKIKDEQLLMKMQAPKSVFWTFNINNIFLIFTLIIYICRFSKVMASSSGIESNSKYTSIIITDSSTTTKAALSNVESFQTQKTDVRNREERVCQAAN